ncbi:MAG: hypothetical protein H6535_04185 [Bacteroidia bacterium]|nr:hypothetical protein [Bacteroidota bacterium]MCB8930278.1 hypothetical protein [Bacteroidia bacterium]
MPKVVLSLPLEIVEEIHTHILYVLNNHSNNKTKKSKIDLKQQHINLINNINKSCGFDNRTGFKFSIGAIESFKFAHNLIESFYNSTTSKDSNTSILINLQYQTKLLIIIGLLNSAFIQKNAILTFLKLSKLDKEYKKTITGKLEKSDLLSTRHKIASHNSECKISDSGEIEPFFPRIIQNDIAIINFHSSAEIYGKDIDLRLAIEEYYNLLSEPLIVILERLINHIYSKNEKIKFEIMKKFKSIK